MEYNARFIKPEGPLDILRTLSPLSRGPFDPTFRVLKGEVLRATRTPEGPAAQRIHHDDRGIHMQAWGPGAAWLIDQMPWLLGLNDDPQQLEPKDKLVARMKRMLPGLRFGRTNAVFEAALPSIIEQKVTGVEAKDSYARLVKKLAQPAPGPLPLTLPPEPRAVASMPYHEFHPIGIERKRADTLRGAATLAGRIEETKDLPLELAYRRLTSIPGIGRWTAAEIGRVAYGDPDAVSVGDYHLKNVVTFAFTGKPRGTDEEMLELLEPYSGQRGRVIRMIELTCPRPPRFGPRMPVRSYSRI